MVSKLIAGLFAAVKSVARVFDENYSSSRRRAGRDILKSISNNGAFSRAESAVFSIGRF